MRTNKKLSVDLTQYHEETVKYIQKTGLDYRKSLGQYFTPKSIREALIKRLPNDIENPRILDPACGTGEFLFTAKEYFSNPDLFGWEIDKKLVDIAVKIVPEAKIVQRDSLLDETYNQFDFVIGNPPYYEFKPSKELRNKFGLVINGRTNIFSLFIYQGIKWLKPGGYLAFVVPSSMNNGAYFLNLRKYISDQSNIEYLHIIEDAMVFHGALQSTMLLILKKGRNQGNYIFKKNGILIFSEDADYIKKSFDDKETLSDLGFIVKTGRLVWNQNKHLLTNNPSEGIPLIWAHNIGNGELIFPVLNKDSKPQYVKINNYDKGPAIVVNRITGSVKASKLKAALIPPGMKFVAENHVNVIFPPKNRDSFLFNSSSYYKDSVNLLKNIIQQIISEESMNIIRCITGNTQVSKNELEKLLPVRI
ncbi:MAG: SAM-dependent DNA methyltransferase [Candidatus Aminicenantes bacterium]|nr:SAM-dependent DNA methyltransferase [Candidatus Aminicenantes bacterium]